MPLLWFDVMDMEFDDPDWSNLNKKPGVKEIICPDDDEIDDPDYDESDLFYSATPLEIERDRRKRKSKG